MDSTLKLIQIRDYNTFEKPTSRMEENSKMKESERFLNGKMSIERWELTQTLFSLWDNCGKKETSQEKIKRENQKREKHLFIYLFLKIWRGDIHSVIKKL